MKTIKKYAYQSPDTEILSLEPKRVLLDSPDDTFVPIGGEGNEGDFGAPWRF